jgi:hypothetical protein
LPQAGWPVFPVIVVPVACASSMLEAPCDDDDGCDELTVPQEVNAVGATTSTGMTGGHDEAHLTLEYLVETGVAVLTVKVTALQPDGVTSTWEDSGITVGFHVQEKVMTVKPGTKLTLEVGDPKVTARLRWCETICC